MDRQIPYSTLAALRGILISSLSRENLGPHDLSLKQQLSRRQSLRKVHFPGEYEHCVCRKSQAAYHLLQRCSSHTLESHRTTPSSGCRGKFETNSSSDVAQKM
ncbi:hypothetical protein TSAR_007354 [Trichomalopsis sarcophagae]|uniref:Uncharacterized protein n=1 Tax=Trichomalopsis sarcophagae TaxID=543379 RepID=A0A232FKG9_9HYME|nr:hypothetical protein TSAR_007354 [Trichomalopsis sarcophagae]